ncbi:diguanylate cyclase [Chloroflexota bacterium]
MTEWAIPPLITSIVYIILLVFILQQIQNRVNKLFAMYIGIAAFWSFTSFMLHLDYPAAQTLFWNQLLVVALVWALIAYYHFVRGYTNKTGGIWLYAGYAILAVVAGLSFSGYIVEYSYVENGVLKHELGNSLFILMGIMLFYAGAVIIQLIRKYRTSTDPTDRNRTMYLIFGWNILVIFTLTNAIESAAAFPLDHMGSLVNALIISYAISKFQLLNIRLVVRRGLLLLMLFLAVIGVSIGTVVLGSNLIDGEINWFAVLFYTLVVLLLIAATRPLGRWAEQRIDRMFYRKTYDHRWILTNFSDKMSNILDLDELSRQLLPALTSALEVTKSEIIFQDTDSGDFKKQYAYPEPEGEIEGNEFSLKLDSPIIARLNKLTGPLYLTQIDNIAELKGLWQVEKEKLEKSGLGILYPLKSRDKLIGILGMGEKQSGSPYSHEDMQIVIGIANQAGVIIENAQLYKRAKTRANTDELTGLHNHRSFHDRLEEEIARDSRFGGTFSLIMLDIDLFKSYNDIYGHLAGDQVLRKVGRYLQNSVRNIDLAFRYGGEEFVVILPEARLDDAYKVAERIRKTIESQTSSRAMPITASLGVGNWPNDGVMKEEVIGMADAALYRAKQTGRNRTCLSSDVLKPDSSLIGIELEAKPRALSMIYALAATVDAKDNYTYGHSKKVSEYAVAVAEKLNMAQDKMSTVRGASLLHDIGKVGVPDSILNKKEPLTDDEWKPIKGHPKLGVEILRHVIDLAKCLPAILHHHEHFDGSGYPAGLKGDQIPLEARILSVADSYDAMTSPRPYRKQLRMEEAVSELQRCAGTQFDPEIVDLFCEIIKPKKIRSLGTKIKDTEEPDNQEL